MRFLKLTLICAFLSCMAVATLASSSGSRTESTRREATEAVAGFDNKTNGYVDQATFDAQRTTFADVEQVADGIGPVYNASSCAECHANPVTGGSSQVLEVRAGHWDGTTFTEHPGGSIIQSRAINAAIQERIMEGNEVRTFRASTSLLGLGYVEAVEDSTLLEIADAQARDTSGVVAGTARLVPVLEAPGVMRVGRFGWKSQHASLLSFSGDAYLNEMGITTPMFPLENTSNGESCSEYDEYPDPDEADEEDLDAFASFIRATKVPDRDARLAATDDAKAGERLFTSMGCAVCHVSTMTTAPVGTVMNGGKFVVTEALGDKIIHPYGDFLLHDIGSGDGIVDGGDATTRMRLRTAPLWGLRTRNRFMHDGATLTLAEAIMRHAGEARRSARMYRKLTPAEQRQVITFLASL